MFKRFVVLAIVFIIIFSSQLKMAHASELWLAIEPHKTGYLKVSAVHEIFYQLGGNPQGKPVMYLHGGPGAGCTKEDFRYFNPGKYHILLHDQRGSGESRPFAEIKENTTWDLVEDIEKLRQHLHLDKVILFGGSWGSTLALAYAETYPQHVAGMILRGVFTSTNEEIDHFYHGGAGKFFPEVFQTLVDRVPHPEQNTYPAQLLKKMQSPDARTREAYAYLWARYEGKIAFLNVADETVEGWFVSWNPLAFSIIENHYMANRCFLEEGQLLKNATRLTKIPTIIVNGRYDVICPPVTAYRLHQLLPKSKLFIVEQAGHSASEPAIQAKLIEAAREFE